MQQFYNYSLWYPSLEKSLGTLGIFMFFRSVIFQLVHAFARSRDWGFLLLMIISLVCHLPFSASFPSHRFYFS